MEDITSFFVLVGIHQHETAPGERVLRRNTNPTLPLRGKLRSTPVAAPLTSPLLKLITKAQPQGLTYHHRIICVLTKWIGVYRIPKKQPWYSSFNCGCCTRNIRLYDWNLKYSTKLSTVILSFNSRWGCSLIAKLFNWAYQTLSSSLASLETSAYKAEYVCSDCSATLYSCRLASCN